MTRLLGIGGQLQVEEREGRPVRFVRSVRGRRRAYVVTDVLARWIESGQWWEYFPSGQNSPGDGRLEAGEREVWRVEAGVERGSSTGVFDLSRAGRRWRLVRIVD